MCECKSCINLINCQCRRCLKGDPGGCIPLENIHASQVKRGIIPADQYFIATKRNGHPK